MGYKAFGVIIEGIWCDPTTFKPSIFGGGMIQRNQFVTIGPFDSYAFKPNMLASTPQLSSTDLDIFTSKIRSGSVTIKLNANPDVSTRLLGQNISRRPNARFTADVDTVTSTVSITGGPTVGEFYYVGEEVIQINSDLGGGSYQVVRSCGETQAQEHKSGDGLYIKPNYWIGRTVKIVVMDFENNFNTNPVFSNTPTDVRVVWRGYLSAAPASVQGTTTIEIKADDLLSILNRIEVNKYRFSFSTNEALTGYLGSNDLVGLLGLLANDEPSFEGQTRVLKYNDYLANNEARAIQIGGSLGVSYGRNIGTSAKLSSPAFVDKEVVTGPFYELAVWSKVLDAEVNDLTGSYISPTYNMPFPYHPLTIAGVLLASSRRTENSDLDQFDVMAPNFSAGIGFLMDLNVWTSLIRETNEVEVDQLILGWDGEPVNLLKVILEQMLPAYGFAITLNGDGRIIPIRTGIADIQQLVGAEITMPLPEYWEWKNIGSEVLDQIVAVVGETPWQQGTAVIVNGLSERTDVSGRTTRLNDLNKIEFNFPTIAQAGSLNYATSRLTNVLIWRFDGLPQITMRLPANEAWYCGQWIVLNKPSGLITPILYDLDGNRSDDWEDYRYIAQITSVRPNIESQYYEVKVVLANYVFAKLAKYRAPSCRIKEDLGSGFYKIEGLTSDFNAPESDAVKFAEGDEIELYDKTLKRKDGISDVISVYFDDPDYVIEMVDVSFDPAPAVGDWIIISQSTSYSNPLRFGVPFPYPFVFMTDDVTLDRPGSTTDIPDTFA